MAFLALLAGLVFFAYASQAQKQGQDRPADIEPGQGAAEARKLIQEILSQRPGEVPTNGTLKIRDDARNERSVAIRMEISQTPTNWTHTYQALPGKSTPGDKLTIIHTPGKSSRYLFTEAGKTDGIELTGNQTMVPFAGSDFWVADLGLEFLHWPKQRLVRKEMSHHKSCVMLESINPNPAKGAYARVDSWMTIESPHNPVRARAYDSDGKQIKEFTPEEVEKVEGRYQLRLIEMRNLKNKTRSLIEFDLQP